MIKFVVRIIENWENHRVRNHILYWVLNVLIYLLFEQLYQEDFFDSLMTKLFYIVPQILATYILVYYLVPTLLMKKRYVLFIFLFIFVSYILSVLSRILIIHGLERIISPLTEINSWFDIFTNMQAIFGQYLIFLYITPMFFVLIKFTKDSFLIRRKLEKLQNEKTITELNFLKSQVHPHFLFNTLNNIYVMALKKSKDTTHVVKNLADLMEYMMVHSTSNYVTIADEVKLLENYIDLEKLRYGERLTLTTNIEIDNPSTLIAPLILLSFIENAFKHGASGNFNNPSIDITLQVRENELLFEVYNTKNKKIQKDVKGYKKGIGVTNVKRQLNLIYPNMHTLEIIEKDHDYNAKLKIELNGSESLISNNLSYNRAI